MAEVKALNDLLEKITEQRKKIKALMNRNEDLELENRNLLEEIEETKWRLAGEDI